MKYLSIVLLSLYISGCSTSYHNINEDGVSLLGGGFIDDKIADGVYRIVAKTNFAPWTNFSAANKTFDRRAKELCVGEFTKFLMVESEYDHAPSMGEVGYVISQVTGYAHCENSTLTLEQAKDESTNWELITNKGIRRINARLL